ncbi:MAG: LytR C-terminal domain-containing protein [Microgenomates group bacterium]
MSLFSKPRVVIWPRVNSLSLYFDRSENNIFSLDVCLWKPLSESDTAAFKGLIKEQGIDTATVLVPDDVVFTKSFIYDSEITEIDKNEVIGLAKSFITFKISPESIDYNLVQASGKTIIQARIFDQSKFSVLQTNLSLLGINLSFESVSQSIANLISHNFTDQYFLIYPHDTNEYLLMLAAGSSVYLTNIIKGKDLEIQKIINYSKLYFPDIVTKIFTPSDITAEIIATTKLDKLPYNQSVLATDFKKTSNLPLPVTGILVSKPVPPAIINSIDTNSPTPTMENKKNILPFIAVFVITAALASIIIYFVLNKNTSAPETPVVTDITPTIEVPTSTPVPTLAEISKKIKLQVLNATEINGQAAVLKEKLVNLGFTSVTVGNSKDKLTENKLQIKASITGADSYFTQQLAGFFDVVPTMDLPETSTYDAVFSIGVKLVALTAEASPTAKVTTAATSATPTAKASGTATPTE